MATSLSGEPRAESGCDPAARNRARGSCLASICRSLSQVYCLIAAIELMNVESFWEGVQVLILRGQFEHTN
jgi:predicted component of type VI protein secretion system